MDHFISVDLGTTAVKVALATGRAAGVKEHLNRLERAFGSDGAA